jgi:hypothetical protein
MRLNEISLNQMIFFSTFYFSKISPCFTAGEQTGFEIVMQLANAGKRYHTFTSIVYGAAQQVQKRKKKARLC